MAPLSPRTIRNRSRCRGGFEGTVKRLRSGLRTLARCNENEGVTAVRAYRLARLGSKRSWNVALVGAMALSTVATLDASASSRHALQRRALSTTTSNLPGTSCPAFPANNVWNTPINTLPVNIHSAAWLSSMNAASSALHPDYGPSGDPKRPYGIPWNVVSATTKFTHINFQYASESDRVPYPLSSTTPIENGSDRHALMVDPRRGSTSAPCTLFETWNTRYRTGGRSSAGSGATWNLTSNALRHAGYTSADAAGLPILVGLVNYDEVAAGTLHHAIRFTADCTQRSYLWPALHQAGVANANCPPMGARFRLNASFSLSTSICHSACQVVLNTLKTYGMILADNGSNWYFQGTADRRWTYQQVDELKQIPASQFVAVDESCLMVSVNSAQALQPGSAAFQQHCS